MKVTLILALLCATPAFAGVYHKTTCPNVDRTRMTEMSRVAAETLGSTPAPDCHPVERMQYLGVSWSSPFAPAIPERSEHVSGYTRADGTVVDGYYRRPARR